MDLIAGNAIFHYLEKTTYTDLIVYEAGIEQCNPLKDYGPIVRPNLNIHYIVSGRGTVKTGGNTYTLGKGQAFIVFPGTLNYYQADEKDPWLYSWIIFGGLKSMEYLEAAGLSAQSPIYTPKAENPHAEQYLREIVSSHDSRIKVNGLSHLLFESLITYSLNKKIIPKRSGAPDYVESAIQYITMNYQKPLRTQEIADYCGINRSYFYNVFKKETGYSPKEFIIKFKMDRACEFLSIPDLTIGDVARSVGYKDPLTFSREFKKFTGYSPSHYKHR